MAEAKTKTTEKSEDKPTRSVSVSRDEFRELQADTGLRAFTDAPGGGIELWLGGMLMYEAKNRAQAAAFMEGWREAQRIVEKSKTVPAEASSK